MPLCSRCKEKHKEKYALCLFCRNYLNAHKKSSSPKKKQEYDQKYRQKLKKERYNNIINYIKSNKGQCFTNYNSFEDNAHIKFHIKCKNGHNFELSAKKIEENIWCPICSQLLGEYISIQAIEYLTEERFKKSHPKWLNGLELDGYNEKIEIALEYNGRQHYTNVPFFHRGDYTFKRQKKVDKIKIKECEKNNISLIIVPYTINNDDICYYIYDILKNIIGFNCINTPKYFSYRVSNRRIDETYDTIKRKKGILLDQYISSIHDFIEIQCNNGHVWKIKAKYINQGQWCFECIKDDKYKNISTNLSNYYQTEDGKANKTEALKKRSETMKKIKEEKTKTITKKLCKKCGPEKGLIDISNFNKKSAAADGLQSYCKDCTRGKKQEWRSNQNNDLFSFKCPQCSSSYKIKDSLTRHIKEKHLK